MRGKIQGPPGTHPKNLAVAPRGVPLAPPWSEKSGVGKKGLGRRRDLCVPSDRARVPRHYAVGMRRGIQKKKAKIDALHELHELTALEECACFRPLFFD